MTLSVGAAVTSALDNNLSERLHWLEIVLSILNPQVAAKAFPDVFPMINRNIGSGCARSSAEDHECFEPAS